MRSRAWRIAQFAFGLAVLVFAGRSLLDGWQHLREQKVVWQVQPLWIAASLLLTWLMYAVLIEAWRAMLAGWRQRIAWTPAARIWTLSSLGKYIPGQVWAIASMAVMAQRAGVPPWAATASSILLQGIAIGTGAAVVGLTGAAVLSTRIPYVPAILLGLIVASAAGVLALLWPPVVSRILRLLRIEGGGAAPRWFPILEGIAANLVAWLGYGAAFWLLARGLFGPSALDYRLALGAFTAAYLAGFLAFGVPAGLGARELVFTALLQGPLGLAPAAALVVASRLCLTVAEFGAAAPFVLLFRETRRVQS